MRPRIFLTNIIILTLQYQWQAQDITIGMYINFWFTWIFQRRNPPIRCILNKTAKKSAVVSFQDMTTSPLLTFSESELMQVPSENTALGRRTLNAIWPTAKEPPGVAAPSEEVINATHSFSPSLAVSNCIGDSDSASSNHCNDLKRVWVRNGIRWN